MEKDGNVLKGWVRSWYFAVVAFLIAAAQGYYSLYRRSMILESGGLESEVESLKRLRWTLLDG
jgi:hypothetical protein